MVGGSVSEGEEIARCGGTECLGECEVVGRCEGLGGEGEGEDQEIEGDGWDGVERRRVVYREDLGGGDWLVR